MREPWHPYNDDQIPVSLWLPDRRPDINRLGGPLVSIGLPTYNGAAHLRGALDSLLAQDYPEIEILISDNASTDDTPAILSEYAARVKIVRQESNIGAAANFKFVLQEARGELFMWAGDDDRWEPSYVSACVAALEDHPEAVLACTRLTITGDDIDPAFAADFARFDNPELSSTSARERVRRLMSQTAWYQIYGLIRRDALLAESMPNIYGGDVVLLVSLLLKWPFVRVDEPLFHYRVYRVAAEDRPAGRGIADFLTDKARARARNTYFAEACSRAIWSSRLSRREKLSAWSGLVEAVYLRKSMLRWHIGQEAGVRVRLALADHDRRSLLKYAVLFCGQWTRTRLKAVRGQVSPTGRPRSA